MLLESGPAGGSVGDQYLDVVLICLSQFFLLLSKINGMHRPCLHQVHHFLHLQAHLLLNKCRRNYTADDSGVMQPHTPQGQFTMH